MHKASAAMTFALACAIACAAFVVHLRVTRSASKVAAPAVYAGHHVVPDDVGTLDVVLMHYVPELEATFDVTYSDFIGRLSDQTRITFAVQRGRRVQLERFVQRIAQEHASAKGAANLSERVNIVELDVPIGLWSKDRALVLTADAVSSTTTFLVPPKPQKSDAPGTSGSSRPFDWKIIPAVSAAMPERGYEVKELPLAFDAGDFAIAGKRIMFDANLLARNRTRGLVTARALRERITSLLGRDVVMLGTEEGDVPRHHMSMYMAPLPGETVLVGDPSLASRVLGTAFEPGEKSVETGTPLRADFSAAMQERFDRAARDLTRVGFRVVRIPNVPFDDKTYFAYTNGVYETRDGHRRAWVPMFDVPELDRAAQRVYESEGFEVIPVRVRKLFTQHGTIGCLVNVLSRG